MTTHAIEAVDASTVEWIRSGYHDAGSMDFRIRVTSWDTFCACLDAIDGYNAFNPERVIANMEPLWPRLAEVVVGREFSPVIYAGVPYWTHHAQGSDAQRGEPTTDAERARLCGAFLRAMDDAAADELSYGPHMGHEGRAWFNGKSVPGDSGATSARAWWD